MDSPLLALQAVSMTSISDAVCLMLYPFLATYHLLHWLCITLRGFHMHATTVIGVIVYFTIR